MLMYLTIISNLRRNNMQTNNRKKTFNVLSLKLLLSLVIIFNCCKDVAICSVNSPKPRATSPFVMKGYIQATQDWKVTPEFRILFNGKQVINDENGFYSFPIEKRINKYHFLICKNVEQNFEKTNTIENLSVKIEKPYRYFSFTKTGTGNHWIQKEKDLENKKFIIPEDCVIALINPKYVDKIEPWNINLHFRFSNFPKITLKNNFLEKKVKREAAKSLLRSMDLLPFHEKITNEKKVLAKNVQGILTQ